MMNVTDLRSRLRYGWYVAVICFAYASVMSATRGEWWLLLVSLVGLTWAAVLSLRARKLRASSHG